MTIGNQRLANFIYLLKPWSPLYILDGHYSRNDIRFDCEGNRDGRYGIYKLKGTPGNRKYVKIGYWADDVIKVNATDKLVASHCTPMCEMKEYKKMDDNVSTYVQISA